MPNLSHKNTVPRQEHTHSRRTPARQPVSMDTVKAVTQPPPTPQSMAMTNMERRTETMPVHRLLSMDTSASYPAFKRNTVLHRADTAAHSAK